MLIECEPRPRAVPLDWSPAARPVAAVHPLPREFAVLARPFGEVMGRRASRVGGPPSVAPLASLLWHAMFLRERHPFGRFGRAWESRSAPSAGGLHPISLLVLSIDASSPSGFYDHERHRLEATGSEDDARVLNARSIAALTGATCGITLQFAADPDKILSCYEDGASLLWRDAGALTATICLIAAASELNAVPVGRTGTDILRACSLDTPWVGVGAVHVTGALQDAADPTPNAAPRRDEQG